MTLQRFKPGEFVVCVNATIVNPEVIYPKLNEVVTVKGYCSVFPGNIDISEYLYNKNGYLQSFAEYRFAPLISDSVLESELSSVPETISV